MTQNQPTNSEDYCYCGFGKSLIFKVPEWILYNASCKIHDENYEAGGTRMDRMTADVGFLWRMLHDANQQETLSKKRKAVYIALLYFFLVRAFGWLSFFVFNWFKRVFKK